MTDKIAYVASNFVTPAPSFAALRKLLAGQPFKGVKDNVDYYRKGKGVDIKQLENYQNQKEVLHYQVIIIPAHIIH